jgi:hypothetical protein
MSVINPVVVELAKMTSRFVVSSGVSTMVGYAARSSVPKIAPAMIRSRPALVKGFHLFQKVAIPAGAAALAGMASEQAIKYADRKIDETVGEVEAMHDLTANLLKKVNDKDAAKQAAKETPDSK